MTQDRPSETPHPAQLELPRRDHTHQVDDEGVAAARLAVISDLRWIFRDQPLADYGIDAHLEVVAQEAGQELVTGQLIGVQAKSGLSFFHEPQGDGWLFRESHRKHLRYWLEHSLPVIVTLYHPQRHVVYWQLVNEHTVTETGKGFTVHVPTHQRLDASARPALQDAARRRGQQAVAVFDRSLRHVPPTARGPLRRAAAQDRVGAARLAQTLADGRAQPRLTAEQLLVAAPTWLTGSAESAQLLNAVAGYCVDHGHHDVAAVGFQQAADRASDPLASRLRAFTGLALLNSPDRSAAAEHLTTALAGGAVLLADIGLVQIRIAADDARVPQIPDSVRKASPAELDREPTVLNFLAEVRLREGDPSGALQLLERAVQVSGPDSPLRLRIAEVLRRRMQTTGVTSGQQDGRRARELAEQVLADVQEWSGPTSSVLHELLNLETLIATPQDVIRRCTPVAAGGTATDAEAADPQIALRGATTAALTGNAEALELFLVTLGDDPRRQHVAALQLELAEADIAERVAAWRTAIAAAQDDPQRAVIIGRLVGLGQWPIPQAEDLRARSIVSDPVYRLWQLTAQAAGPHPAATLPALRLLAQTQVLAVVVLIRLVERLNGPVAAWKEWQRQFDQWRDLLLLHELPVRIQALEAQGQLQPLETGLIERLQDWLADLTLPADTRQGLRHQLVRLLGKQSAWDRVVRVCRAGLLESPDARLAWNLVAALANSGKLTEAREALLEHDPPPESDQDVHLWTRLRVGTDLDLNDVRRVMAMAEQRGTSQGLGAQLATLALRDIARLQAEAVELPADIVEWQQRLMTDPQLRPEVLQALSMDELKFRLQQRDDTALEELRERVRRGRVSLADLAEGARHPYGQALLQRGAGLLVAADLEDGLQQAGQQAARHALDAGTALVDLSTAYVLVLLPQERQHLQAALPDLRVLAATVADAARTRDAIWTATGPVFTVSLQDGRLHREDMPVADRALLRSQAADLEDLLARMPLAEPVAAAVAHLTLQEQQLAAAQRLGLPLYADDTALRQRARASGIASFGTHDLLLVAAHQTGLDIPAAVLRLAEAGIVDLPIAEDQLQVLGAAQRWQGGPALLLLSRPPWWRLHHQDWPTLWRAAAAAAAGTSEQALVTTTVAALHGALAACSSSLATQRYQQVVVHALDAAHAAGLRVPSDYLQQLAGHAAGRVAPRPRFVHQALVEALRHRGVQAAPAAADGLLPGAAW